MHTLSIGVAARKSRLGALFLLAGCLVGGTSCSSTSSSPSSTGFASVTISGNTPGQIRDAAVEVFAHDGYTVAQSDPGNLVFEKQGSKMSNFAYGSWVGDTPVWMRVKAAVVPAGELTWRLQCRAYLVRDRGSATEEELTVSGLHKGQYQRLLDEVAVRLTKR